MNVNVSIANEGEMSISRDIVSKWEPKNIIKLSDTTFFSVGGVTFGMKTLDFKEIFNK